MDPQSIHFPTQILYHKAVFEAMQQLQEHCTKDKKPQKLHHDISFKRTEEIDNTAIRWNIPGEFLADGPCPGKQKLLRLCQSDLNEELNPQISHKSGN